jgi:hypothetical protein
VAVSEPRVLDIIGAALPLSVLSSTEREAFERIDLNLVSEWIRFIYPEMKNNPHAGYHLREFLKRTSASEHAIADWLERVLVTYRWLQNKQSTAHFSDVIEYASCALQGNSHHDGRDVAWYLEQYGFERSWRVS